MKSIKKGNNIIFFCDDIKKLPKILGEIKKLKMKWLIKMRFEKWDLRKIKNYKDLIKQLKEWSDK